MARRCRWSTPCACPPPHPPPTPPFLPQIKCYLRQLFSGLALLQTADVLHRDLKNANLLVNNQVCSGVGRRTFGCTCTADSTGQGTDALSKQGSGTKGAEGGAGRAAAASVAQALGSHRPGTPASAFVRAGRAQNCRLWAGPLLQRPGGRRGWRQRRRPAHDQPRDHAVVQVRSRCGTV